MARTALTPGDADHQNGLVVTFEAANVDGNSVEATDMRVLVRNGDSVDHTVTQLTGGTARGVPIDDPAVTVPAGGIAVLGPWPPLYRQPGTSEVWLDYDAVTLVDVAAVRG